MKLPILLSSLALIIGLTNSPAQQPTPDATAVQKANAQAQKQRQQRRIKRAQAQSQSQDNSQSPTQQSLRRPRAVQATSAVNQGRHHRQPAPPNIQPNQTPSYSEALQRCRRERHDRSWWKTHYTTIVLCGGGYYYWDTGYWFPALGFDPAYEYYEYNGPIFTYGNLLPDQVIANVQRALQELGYYSGNITGALTSYTRSVIAAYQEDYGLEVTAVVDGATVASLGLI